MFCRLPVALSITFSRPFVTPCQPFVIMRFAEWSLATLGMTKVLGIIYQTRKKPPRIFRAAVFKILNHLIREKQNCFQKFCRQFQVKTYLYRM